MHDHAVLQDVRAFPFCVFDLWAALVPAPASLGAGLLLAAGARRSAPCRVAALTRPCPRRPAPPCRSVGRHKRPLAEMCVQAVLGVADLERKDVNLDLIKVRNPD